MTQKELRQKVRERRARLFNKSLFLTLALLIPPIVLSIAIVVTALYTYVLSLFLLYFVLPMFYTVERRLRYDITGIGKSNFTYVDGYKDFFTKNTGGIFGALVSIILALLLLFVLVFALEYALPSIADCFPNASEVLKEASTLFASSDTTTEEFTTYILENGAALAQPLTVLVGAAAFLPLFYLTFYAFDTNLDNHFIATIVLPDIDKNLSAAQARTLSRVQFARNFQAYRLKQSFLQNYPFYIAYVALYALVLYACTFITTDNFMVVPLIVLLAPSLSLFYGFLLNYFCLANDYSVIEESQDVLLESIPAQIRFTIYQTYCNPAYVHGEESAARGCFVPAPSYTEQQSFQNPFNPFQQNPFNPPSDPASRKDAGTTVDNPSTASAATTEEKQEEKPTGVVIDLSGSDENKEKKD